MRRILDRVDTTKYKALLHFQYPFLMRLGASWLLCHKVIKKPHKHGHILLEIYTFFSGIRAVGHIG